MVVAFSLAQRHLTLLPTTFSSIVQYAGSSLLKKTRKAHQLSLVLKQKLICLQKGSLQLVSIVRRQP
jgi:hypothetical protein